MDPSRILRPKGADDDVDAGRAAPAAAAPVGSLRTSMSSSSRHFVKRAGDCSYWTVAQRQCLNGECRDLNQLFRQCANKPIEQALVDDPKSERDWAPAPEPSAGIPALPSFMSLGRATDDLVRDIGPELERMQRSMDALTRGIDEHPWKTLGGLLSGGLGSLAGDDDGEEQRRRGGLSTRSSLHRSGRLAAQDEEEAARRSNPLWRIGNSLATWTDSISRAVTGGNDARPDDEDVDNDK